MDTFLSNLLIFFAVIAFFIIKELIFPSSESNKPDSPQIDDSPPPLVQDTQIHPDLDALSEEEYPILESILDAGFDLRLFNAFINTREQYIYSGSEYKHYDPLYQAFLEKKNTYFQSAKWKVKRNSILKRDNDTCVLCKATSEEVVLNAHHKTYKNLFNENMDELVTLCIHCHKDLHKAYGYPRIQSENDWHGIDDVFWSDRLEKISELNGRYKPRGKPLFLG